MKKTNLGILGGGQLGCMLCMAAKKLDVYTIVWSDDPMSPAKEFSDEFILSNYNNEEKINYFNFLTNINFGSTESQKNSCLSIYGVW